MQLKFRLSRDRDPPVAELEGKLRRQGLSIGLRVPRDIRFDECHGSRAVLTAVDLMDKLEHGFLVAKKKGRKVIMVTARKNAGLLPGVQTLFDEKRTIIDDVCSGRRGLTENDWKQFKPIFKPHEFQALVDYTCLLRREKEDKKTFGEMVAAAARGELTSKRLDYFGKVLGEEAAAKMTILYNDLMDRFGNRKKMLREGGRIKRLRKYVEDLKRQNEEATALLKLVKHLELGQFNSSKSFIEAIKALGSYATLLFDSIDWRDKPFLIQFAVVANEKIENPLYHKNLNDHPKYASEVECWVLWGTRDRDEFVKTLEDTKRKLLSGMKTMRLI
jgi:hypothetical protein